MKSTQVNRSRPRLVWVALPLLALLAACAGEPPAGQPDFNGEVEITTQLFPVGTSAMTPVQR